MLLTVALQCSFGTETGRGGDAGGNGGDCGGGSGGGSDVKICALTVPATVLTRPMGGPNVAEATYLSLLVIIRQL